MPSGCSRAHRKACAQLTGERHTENWSEQGSSGRSVGHIHSADQSKYFGVLDRQFPYVRLLQSAPRDPCAQCTHTEAKAHHCTCLHRYLTQSRNLPTHFFSFWAFAALAKAFAAKTRQLLHCGHPQLLLTLPCWDLPHQSADPCYLCLPNNAATVPPRRKTT